MNKHLSFYTVILTFCHTALLAQVQVSEEPFHQKVIENKYFRLLDVWIEPGDTTLFHVHSTPSLFTQMTDTYIQTQVKGEQWLPDTTKAGYISYNSFLPKKLIHRVCNIDTEAMHVFDIELLSRYDADHQIPDVPQPFPLLMDSERAYAYQMNGDNLKGLNLVTPGPMIAILISGGPLTFHNEMKAESSEITQGQFAYFDTGTFLTFTFDEKSDINMILFELK